MCEPSKKRIRKTKLVPREYLDVEEEADIISQDKIQEPNNSIDSQLLLPKFKNTITEQTNYRPDNIQSPVQFSIQVEVEQCEDEDTKKQEYHPQVYGPFIYKISEEIIISKETLDLEYARLARLTLTPVDKQLEIEIRNHWGKHPSPVIEDDPYEAQIQHCIANFKSWYSQSKVRFHISMYKCFLCQLGWWNLQDFRNHIPTHKKIDVTLQCFNHECYVVASNGECQEDAIRMQVGGKCPHCLKTFEEHILLKRSSPQYSCDGCNERFVTCAMLFEHEGICQRYGKIIFQTEIPHESLFQCSICHIFCLTESRYNEHLQLNHSVRSDLPSMYPCYKTCSCGIKYLWYNLHFCPKKNDNIQCSFCCRKFPNRQLCDIHEKNGKSNFETDCCNKVLKKQCMQMEHIVVHSNNYTLAHKCLLCKDHVLFSKESSLLRHKSIWHQKRIDKRRANCEVIIAPKSCMKVKHTTEEDLADMVLHKLVSETKPSKNKLPATTSGVSNKIKKPVKTGSRETGDINEETIKIMYIDNDLEDQDSKVTLNMDETTNAVNFFRSEQALQNSVEEPLYGETKNILPLVVKAWSVDPNAESETDSKTNSIFSMKRVKEEVKEESIVNNDIQNTLYSVDDIKKEVIEEDCNLPYQFKIKTEIKEEIVEETGNDLDEIDIDDSKCLEELSKVFQASKDLEKSFVEPLNEEVIIKDEPIDEEFFEDDIIVLDASRFDLTQLTQQTNKAEETEFESTVSAKTFQKVLKDDSTVVTNRSKRIYDCRKCGFEGEHKALKEHYITTCKMKPHRFRPKKDYTRELWKGYKCSKCNSEFLKLREYTDHLIVHNVPITKCPQCSINVQSVNLSSHLIAHIKRSFMRIQVIKEAVCTNSKTTGLYECRVCSDKICFDNFFSHWEGHLKFDQEGSLVIDEDRDVSVRGNDDVDDISLTTEQIKALLVQLLTSFGRVSLKSCVHCNRGFVRRNDCKRHVIEHLLRNAYALRPKYKGLKCQLCELIFPKGDKYKRHMRNHGSLPIFKCELCDKNFSDSSNFAKHKKVHNLQIAVCDICGKKFHSKSGLEKHLEMHRTMKPLPCNHCDKVFYNESLYKKHIRGLSNIQSKFPCKVCRRRYNTLKDLWDHMWEVHKERKTEADCPVCNNAQATREISDIVITTSIDQSTCYSNPNMPIRSFRKFQDVKAHVKSHHNMSLAVLRNSAMDRVLLAHGGNQKVVRGIDNIRIGNNDIGIRHPKNYVDNAETLVVFE